MRILFLTKRQYTGKDLLDDRYGRLYEIPAELASRGHQVKGMCLSYRSRCEGHLAGPQLDNTFVNWYSFNIGSLILPGFLRYLREISRLIRDFKPDIIVACSDAFHVLGGVLLAKKKRIPCIVDLYDNFESFGATKLPGLISCFRWAVSQASGVSCVSDILNGYITKSCTPKGFLRTIENGISTKLFYPREQLACRRKMGLPPDAKIIGTAGSLGQSRGLDVLFESFAELATRDSSVHLALAGPVEPGTKVPVGLQIHYVGNIPHEEVPFFLSALDIGIICNVDSPFGRYCFPQKAYEMLTCGISVVAAKVGVMEFLFADYPECLFALGDSHSLTEAVLEQLDHAIRPDLPPLTWHDLAVKFETLLIDVYKKENLADQ